MLIPNRKKCLIYKWKKEVKEFFVSCKNLSIFFSPRHIPKIYMKIILEFHEFFLLSLFLLPKRSSLKTKKKNLLMLCSGDKFKHSRLLSCLLSLFFSYALLKGGIFRDLNKINSFLCIITFFLLFYNFFSTFFFLLSENKLSTAMSLTVRVMSMTLVHYSRKNKVHLHYNKIKSRKSIIYFSIYFFNYNYCNECERYGCKECRAWRVLLRDTSHHHFSPHSQR